MASPFFGQPSVSESLGAPFSKGAVLFFCMTKNEWEKLNRISNRRLKYQSLTLPLKMQWSIDRILCRSGFLSFGVWNEKKEVDFDLFFWCFFLSWYYRQLFLRRNRGYSMGLSLVALRKNKKKDCFFFPSIL